MKIESVSVDDLHTRLGFDEPLRFPTASRNKSLTQWKMELDDAPILRYLYRHLNPKRHLEFGTWLGQGTVYCLEESAATVWTINLAEGESQSDGGVTYPASAIAEEELPDWLRQGQALGRVRSDAQGIVGLYYLNRGYGNRVCQVLCDIRAWDTSQYSDGFFDTVLVDGGHTEEIVSSDTAKALRLLRKGGVILWHDYCPQHLVDETCGSTVGVVAAIDNNMAMLEQELSDLFWIEPSWILLGIKR